MQNDFVATCKASYQPVYWKLDVYAIQENVEVKAVREKNRVYSENRVALFCTQAAVVKALFKLPL